MLAETKDRLPAPIYDENLLYVRMYWKTWELAFRNFYEPPPQSGFVSQFIDAAFNQNIFLWDTCFLTMFCNYGHPLVPGIGSLDNFYAKQYADGEICREINRTTGRDFADWTNPQGRDLFSRWGKYSVTYVDREIPRPPPRLTLDALNHPIFAWAELESLRVTGDRARVKLVYDPLVRYYRVPTTPADQEGFDPAGGYWRGAVWAPTNTMVIRGLEKYGRHRLAREIAMEHLRIVGEVFEGTGTVWENYAPEEAKPGKPAKPDFVGWTGIVPILYFIEYGIGLKPDAPNNRLTWTLTTEKRCGCERFRFNGHTATLIAEPSGEQPGAAQVTVESDGDFQLSLRRGEKQGDFSVKKGKTTFPLR